VPIPAVSTDIQALASSIRQGSRRALARAITLVESTRDDHRDDAEALLALLAPSAGGAHRIGISGTPGVGKSTFIEALGNHIVDLGKRIAVLTVDPSSTRSGGSILGDKTRMEQLSRRSEAFIRPSPAGTTLGGVARRTREALLLCESAGFDAVIVETVGVGQSETAVSQMTDTFVLLLQPGSGDELQGIKRGIMELADIVLVNKADGDLERVATRAAAEYQAALRFLQPRSPLWEVAVATCSATTGRGIAEAWELMRRHQTTLGDAGQLTATRLKQNEQWFWTEAAELLTNRLRNEPSMGATLETAVAELRTGSLPPTVAARQVVAEFLKRDKLEDS